MMSQRLNRILFFVLALSLGLSAFGQSKEQKELESKRARLQQEIKEINRLLGKEKKQKGDVLGQMEVLDQKINVSQQLIRVTNQQSNLLNRQINTNVRKISQLKEDLISLKDEYAEIIQKSYQNKSQNSRLMFLLSADNFFQAFKRFQYMKQYTEYRKQQGQEIIHKTEVLAQLNIDLTDQRKEKDKLVAENRVLKNELYKEMQVQKELLKTIRKNESQYLAKIEAKQREARKIDRQIEELIKSAIAASNKSSGSTKSVSFALTPEATLVANNFTANKGRLIWPVEKGIKSRGFGVYSDPVYPGIKHQNNGVIISTDEGTEARAVFEGEVIAILAVPGGNKGVQIKHGNYISTYYNLSELYVKKGDKVKVKDFLGKIFTNRTSGQTQLKFYLYQNTTKLNPEEWIYQL
jgi:septal ring factor EnvC (AmiA/AmiB activator)